jgi:DNA-binding YbaB/EbfC family protein
MFGNMGDMMGMMGKMKDLQARMKEAQEQLAGITESAESGAGLVRVTVNGQKKVVGLDIDNDLIKPEDKEMLQDLLVAAINKAMETIEPKIKEHLQKSTEGLLPNIPGMDLGNLMK